MSSKGFWQKIDTYQEQPDIHFEHEMIILLETADPDQSFGWSTMANFNSLLDDRSLTTLFIQPILWTLIVSGLTFHMQFFPKTYLPNSLL